MNVHNPNISFAFFLFRALNRWSCMRGTAKTCRHQNENVFKQTADFDLMTMISSALLVRFVRSYNNGSYLIKHINVCTVEKGHTADLQPHFSFELLELLLHHRKILLRCSLNLYFSGFVFFYSLCKSSAPTVWMLCSCLSLTTSLHRVCPCCNQAICL